VLSMPRESQRGVSRNSTVPQQVAEKGLFRGRSFSSDIQMPDDLGFSP
jgi:hypothetical protein